jgi:hypothetical protein
MGSGGNDFVGVKDAPIVCAPIPNGPMTCWPGAGMYVAVPCQRRQTFSDIPRCFSELDIAISAWLETAVVEAAPPIFTICGFTRASVRA